MVTSLIRRFLLFIFSLAGIIIIGFFLTRAMPGDPVKRLLGIANPSEAGKFEVRAQQYDALYYKLGYNLPLFYFTWSSLAVPDSFYYLPNQDRREQLIHLSALSGNPSGVYKFRQDLDQLFDNISNYDQFYNLKLFLTQLKKENNFVNISGLLKGNHLLVAKGDALTLTNYRNLEETSIKLSNHSQSWKRWIPIIGLSTHNQFHYWLFGNQQGNSTGVIQGNFGNSTVTNKKVADALFGPLKITFLFSFLALALSLLVAIPVAVWLVKNKNRKIAKVIPEIFLFIYATPSFFIATLLLILFANPEVFQIFPTSGIAPVGGFPNDAGLFYKFIHSIPYYILPLIAYSLGSAVFFIRLLQTSLAEQLTSDYVRTARAKGLSDDKIISTHALRNSLIPLLAIVTSAIPAMISGAVILENIFSIPGMGTELVRAVQNQDYPVLTGFFLLIGIFTIMIFTVSDYLYSLADPRITFKVKN